VPCGIALASGENPADRALRAHGIATIAGGKALGLRVSLAMLAVLLSGGAGLAMAVLARRL
jgi:hypothetical protein